jgi:hypothetical protein
MFLVKFFKKHQKKILILLVILAALFLINRQFRILEGAENRKVTIRPPPRNPLISTGSSTSVPDNRKVTIRLPPRNPLISTGSSGGSSTSAPTNVSGSAVQMTAAMKHICGVMPNAPGCKK